MKWGCRERGEVSFLPFSPASPEPVELREEQAAGRRKKAKGEPLTQSRARERGGPGASGAFVCGRGAGALGSAGPSPGALQAPAGAGTARLAAPAPAPAAAPAPTRARTSQCSPLRLRPEPGPAPGPPGPHLLRRRARGSPAFGGRGGAASPARPASFSCSPGPLGRAVPEPSACSVDGPSPTQPPRRQPHLGCRAPAFSESSPGPGVAWPSSLGAGSPESSLTFEARPHSCPREGTPRALPGRDGAVGSGVLLLPGRNPGLCRVRPALLQRPEAGTPGRRSGRRGPGGAGGGNCRRSRGRRAHVHGCRAWCTGAEPGARGVNLCSFARPR